MNKDRMPKAINMKAHPDWLKSLCVCVRACVYLFVENRLLQSVKEETHSFIFGVLADTFTHKI